MRVLLDTHTFLWWAEDSPKLSRKARKIIGAPEHRCMVSLVCAWEMAVKVSIGKLKLPAPLSNFFPHEIHIHDFDQLEINLRALCRVESLPMHHRDPFDTQGVQMCNRFFSLTLVAGTYIEDIFIDWLVQNHRAG